MSDDRYFLINKFPEPLSKEEMQELFIKAQNGSKVARDKLVLHNIRLILHEVKKFNIDLDQKKDLFSAGSIGLLKAVDNYDISKGYEFSTYAIRLIRNEMLMFLKSIRKHDNLESLDREYPLSDGKITVGDLIPCGNDVQLDYEKKEMFRIIMEKISDLPELYKRTIMLYFGFCGEKKYDQNEIAKIYGVSRSYVAYILKKAIKKIRHDLSIKAVVKNSVEQEDNERVKLHDEITAKPAKRKTIYDYFKNYSKEQINAMLLCLDDDELELVRLRYGVDLTEIESSDMTREEYNSFYGALLPKMRRLLKTSYRDKNK